MTRRSMRRCTGPWCSAGRCVLRCCSRWRARSAPSAPASWSSRSCGSRSAAAGRGPSSAPPRRSRHRPRSHDGGMATSLPFKVRGVAATMLEHVPVPGPRPLADPPPGSGLAPVMGEPGPPVVGHSLLFLKDNLRYSRQFYERYGTVSWGNSLGTQVVSVLGPAGIETVLTNRDRAFSNAEGWGYFIGPFFERGVMLMDFEEHRHHRRIMQQAFKRPRLETYIARANETIARRLAEWRPGSGFRLYDAAKQLTLDIATEVFMGDR